MTTRWMPLATWIAGATLALGGCEEQPAAPPTATPSARATSVVAPVVASPAPVPPASGSAEPGDEPAPAAGAADGGKTFNCGAKTQKACPMQGWMKSVMATASSGGDGAKLATALEYVAAHPPPGYGTWSAMSTAAAAKAKAGDIDGAKLSCKQCHDEYKEKYKATMRDRPF